MARRRKKAVTAVGDITGTQYVRKTTDYSIFKELKGNREVAEKRISKLVKSFVDNGWLMNPILVNEKMEVIDGQARLEALKILKMPAYYIIQEGLTVEHCRAMNIYQSNWSIRDYVVSYAKSGMMSYEVLREAGEKSKDEKGRERLTYTILTAAYSGKNGNITGSHAKIMNGEFEVVDKAHGDYIVNELLKIYDTLSLVKGRTEYMCQALIYAMRYEAVDMDRMARQIQKRCGEMNEVASIEGALKEFEKVYNYKKRGMPVNWTGHYNDFTNMQKKKISPENTSKTKKTTRRRVS